MATIYENVRWKNEENQWKEMCHRAEMEGELRKSGNKINWKQIIVAAVR